MRLYRPPRNVLLLGLTSLFNDASSEMVLSVFPAFFTSVLKTGAASLGIVEGIADGAANLIKIYAGQLSDRIQRRKPFAVGGYTLSTLTRPGYLIVRSVSGVIGLRLLDRVGKGLREGPRDALISLGTPEAELGRAFGFHRMLDTFGAIIGPFVAYLILRRFPDGFQHVFSLALVIGLLAIASLLLVSEVNGQVRSRALTLGRLQSFPPAFRRYLLGLFFLAAGSLPVTVLLLKTQLVGLTLASIPLLYMVANLAYAGFSLAAGSLSDRVGPHGVLAGGYGILVLAYACLAGARSVTLLVLGFLIYGLFQAFTDGVARAYAAQLSKAAQRGSAFGFVNATTGFGLLIAGIAGGELWQHQGPNTALLIGAFTIVIGLAVLSTIPKLSP